MALEPETVQCIQARLRSVPMNTSENPSQPEEAGRSYNYSSKAERDDAHLVPRFSVRLASASQEHDADLGDRCVFSHRNRC